MSELAFNSFSLLNINAVDIICRVEQFRTSSLLRMSTHHSLATLSGRWPELSSANLQLIAAFSLVYVPGYRPASSRTMDRARLYTNESL